jgi:hypothetical protein
MNLAYCGLDCESCLIHTASLEEDAAIRHSMRVDIANQCNKLYGTNLQPVDVNNCDGCRADTGRLFSGCMTCAIRKCAMDKKIAYCGYCSNYVCELLEKHFMLDPEARSRLDEIRQMTRKNEY